MKVGFGITVIVFLALIISYQSALGREGELIKKLEKANFTVKDVFIPFKGKQIRVVETGNPKGEDLIFIHGSPGDWTGWGDIIIDSSLQQRFNIIIVDRPGYGKSTVNAQVTLVDQAQAIHGVIEYLKLENIIIASHSYGGGVAEQLMISFPSNIKHNVFISPTLSPELQQPKWYNKVGRRIKFMLPKDFKSSNIEMWGLANSLQQNEEKIKDIKIPITFFHGEKDWLVPIETVDYFKKYSASEVKYIIEPKESHFMLWTKPELIIDEILNID